MEGSGSVRGLPFFFRASTGSGGIEPPLPVMEEARWCLMLSADWNMQKGGPRSVGMAPLTIRSSPLKEEGESKMASSSRR